MYCTTVLQALFKLQITNWIGKIKQVSDASVAIIKSTNFNNSLSVSVNCQVFSVQLSNKLKL